GVERATEDGRRGGGGGGGEQFAGEARLGVVHGEVDRERLLGGQAGLGHGPGDGAADDADRAGAGDVRRVGNADAEGTGDGQCIRDDNTGRGDVGDVGRRKRERVGAGLADGDAVVADLFFGVERGRACGGGDGAEGLRDGVGVAAGVGVARLVGDGGR